MQSLSGHVCKLRIISQSCQSSHCHVYLVILAPNLRSILLHIWVPPQTSLSCLCSYLPSLLRASLSLLFFVHCWLGWASIDYYRKLVIGANTGSGFITDKSLETQECLSLLYSPSLLVCNKISELLKKNKYKINI